jgi:predicted CXXCH cytochrome family protein
VGYQPGLALDESVFVLAPSDDETVWWPTGHARTYNEYGEWLASRHGQAVAMGPVCGRCHGTETDSTDPTPDDDTLAAGPINGITCVACHNPHPAAPSSYPAMLKDDPYVLCVSCHNSRTPDGGIQVGTAGSPLHHPVQEMFEGQEIVDEVAGVPSAHFSAAEGPRCATCHMPQTIQIGEFGRAGSHTMLPALPGDAIEPDSCSGCHGELVTRADIQRFITNTETITGSRVAAIEAQMSQTTPKWIETAMALINGDGSRGIHNPAYTDALLDAAEIELGIYPAMSPTLSPEDLGIPSRPQGQAGEQAGETNVAEGGLTTPSIVILVICGLILALGAYAFFVREPRP